MFVLSSRVRYFVYGGAIAGGVMMFLHFYFWPPRTNAGGTAILVAYYVYLVSFLVFMVKDIWCTAKDSRRIKRENTALHAEIEQQALGITVRLRELTLKQTWLQLQAEVEDQTMTPEDAQLRFMVELGKFEAAIAQQHPSGHVALDFYYQVKQAANYGF